jgi:hypothetical protein
MYNATSSERCDLTVNSDSDNVHTNTHTHTHHSAPVINILNQRCPKIPIICILDQNYVGKHYWISDNTHIHLNVILRTTPRFSKKWFPFRFSTRNIMRVSLLYFSLSLSLSHVCYLPCPSYLPLCDRPNNPTVNMYLYIKLPALYNAMNHTRSLTEKL